MKGVPVFTKAVGWVRADYPRAAPGGHLALLAMCRKRPADSSRR